VRFAASGRIVGELEIGKLFPIAVVKYGGCSPSISGDKRRKIYRQATGEDGGRRDENRRTCSIFLDYLVINASLPR